MGTQTKSFNKRVNERIINYLPWKSFTVSIVLPVLGLFLMITGIFNFYSWSTVSRVVSIFAGLFLAIFGVYMIKLSYKLM